MLHETDIHRVVRRIPLRDLHAIYGVQPRVSPEIQCIRDRLNGRPRIKFIGRSVRPGVAVKAPSATPPVVRGIANALVASAVIYTILLFVMVVF